ncbi:hypothetical protein NDU88_002483 [Pleurodeles waltl]|uniref:Uncharacterized protein n=1 Tax=Pleurodeles waltl TaxID=8319 RepID=A0AAV7M8A9_PLEWA|nr:hypothetical protein NDU88_002483 [Pleurodeles waltl]
MEGTISKNTPDLLELWLCLRKQMSPHRDFWGSPAIRKCHRNASSVTRWPGSDNGRLVALCLNVRSLRCPLQVTETLWPGVSEPLMALRDRAARGASMDLRQWAQRPLYMLTKLSQEGGPEEEAQDWGSHLWDPEPELAWESSPGLVYSQARHKAEDWRKGVPTKGSSGRLVRAY